MQKHLPDQPSKASVPASRPLVAVAACDSYAPETVARALAEALDLCGGLGCFIRPNATVLIKPNLLSPRPPEEAVTTHPALVRAMIEACAAAGAGKIWVGDSPAGAHSQETLWDKTGMVAAVHGTRAELKSFDAGVSQIPCGGRKVPAPAWYAEVDAIISLPKLKPHLLTGITLGVKNLYGMIPGQAKAAYHSLFPDPHSMGAFLAQVFQAFRPVLTVADAVVAMEGDGPANGRPGQAGLLLASADAVALDSVAARLYRLRPADLPLLASAAALGLGVADPAGISLAGSGTDRLDTVVLRQGPSRCLRRLPAWLFSLGSRLFNLRPRIDHRLCTRCGLCARVCSRQAIKLEGHGPTAYYRVRSGACIRCMCCVEACPHRAVTAVSGWR